MAFSHGTIHKCNGRRFLLDGVIGGRKSEDAVAADSDVAGFQRRRAWKPKLRGGWWWRMRRRREGSSDFEKQRDAMKERRDREKIGWGQRWGRGGGGCGVESNVIQCSLVERLAATEMRMALFGRFRGGRGDGLWRRGWFGRGVTERRGWFGRASFGGVVS
ncbi:hypothetical protein PIB30_099382 [Stylosanthes scabra]|uniref:Uncharacterized protein n=1 Tax=Stylosanthes scabra TaxID=79078 RepID=A0ABU6UYS3_9FABA|nr:hypothetical protein [Stylosanthes scabra]